MLRGRRDFEVGGENVFWHERVYCLLRVMLRASSTVCNQYGTVLVSCLTRLVCLFIVLVPSNLVPVPVPGPVPLTVICYVLQTPNSGLVSDCGREARCEMFHHSSFIEGKHK